MAAMKAIHASFDPSAGLTEIGFPYPESDTDSSRSRRSRAWKNGWPQPYINSSFARGL